VWIDYAGHDAPITPKPGMVLAVSSGTVIPGQMRAAGAATIFFDLHLNDRVGTPSKPADPGTIADKAKREFDFAAKMVRIGGRRLALYLLLAETDREHGGEGEPDSTAELTPREREIATLIAMGKVTPQIADELQISSETVRTHVAKAMMKVGARTRAQMVARLMAEEGLLQL